MSVFSSLAIVLAITGAAVWGIESAGRRYRAKLEAECIAKTMAAYKQGVLNVLNEWEETHS